MNLPGYALLAAVVIVSVVYAPLPPRCFSAKMAADQHFNDSFVCNDCTTFDPTPYMEKDLNILAIRKEYQHDLDAARTLNFLSTATTIQENHFFSETGSVVGDYAYQCVCPSPRRQIRSVYHHGSLCFVVRPQEQNIHYAKCGGSCTFNYPVAVDSVSRAYGCVHQGFVSRGVLLWCPKFGLHHPVPINKAATPGAQFGLVPPSQADPLGYVPYGKLVREYFTLPTLCSCRGYFCEDHASAALNPLPVAVPVTRG